jgi:hypothetical protein
MPLLVLTAGGLLGVLTAASVARSYTTGSPVGNRVREREKNEWTAESQRRDKTEG